MHFKDKKTKSMWKHAALALAVMLESFPPVNNDAVKLSSELIYLFILGMFHHLKKCVILFFPTFV